MKDEITTLQIHISTWNQLNDRKEFGETFEDVIIRMIREFPKYKKLPKNQTMKQIKEEIKKC